MWIDIIICAGWGVAGLLVGRGIKRAAATPKLRTCSCEHGYGYHLNGGRCQKRQQAQLSSTQCQCQVYDGEIPFDVFGRA